MTDTFRKKYKPLSEGQKAQMLKIKEQAEVLEKLIDEAGDPNNMRLMALAKTNL